MNKNIYILLIGGAVLYYLLKKNINKTELKKFMVKTKSGGNVNVRTEPNINSSIFTTFPNEAIFSGEIYDENWVKINKTSYDQREGYINRINLIEI